MSSGSADEIKQSVKVNLSVTMMMLVILNIMGFLSVVSATHFLRIATFNTALTPKVPEFTTRRELIGAGLAQLQADVVCLQEVGQS